MTAILVLLLLDPFLTAVLAAAVTRSARVGALTGFTVAWVPWAFFLWIFVAWAWADSGRFPDETWPILAATYAVMPLVLLSGWIWSLKRIPRAWLGAGVGLAGQLAMVLLIGLAL